MTIDINVEENYKLLSQIQIYDVIEYSTELIKKGMFVVFDIDRDNQIPAMLIQMWRYTGGFDHQVINSLESSFGLNKRIRVYHPRKIITKIIRIISYHSNESDLSDKEQYFFNLTPNEINLEKDEKFQFPYECVVEIDGDTLTLVIPFWSPIQKLPVKDVKEETVLEVWKVKDIYSIMRVIRI